MRLIPLLLVPLLLIPLRGTARAAPTDGELAAVESRLLDVISANPDDADAWFDLATTRLVRQDFPGARAAFELTLEADPQHAPAMNSLGNMMMIEGDAIAALDWYQRAFAASPDDPKAPFNMGEVATIAREQESALGFYTIALGLAPDSRKYAMKVAETHLAMGNPELVHRVLAPVLRADPDDIGALLADGTGYHRAGDYDAALTPFLRARELAPDNLMAQRWVGTACWMTHQWECAEVAYGDALALAPERADLWLERGQARSKLGPAYASRAVADFDKAAELDTESPRPRFELGVLMETAGRDDEALSAYRAALGRDPTHCPSALNAGRLLIVSGRYPEAEATLDSCLRVQPDNEHALLNRGLARARAGLCEMAARDLSPIAEGEGPAAEHAARLMADCR